MNEKRKIKDEVAQIELSIKQHENNRAEWKQKAKELFGISYYANNIFESDDPRKRLEIIRKIGRNIQLTDGVVLLNPNPGLVPIKNMNSKGNVLKMTVGTVDLQRKNAPLEDVFSQWYTRQDIFVNLCAKSIRA